MTKRPMVIDCPHCMGQTKYFDYINGVWKTCEDCAGTGKLECFYIGEKTMKNTHIVIYRKVEENKIKKLIFKNVKDYEICKGFLSMTMESGKIVNYNLNSIEMFEEIESNETFVAMNPPSLVQIRRNKKEDKR